jgi:AAA+ ATPase superfamily predicted ATPase
VVFDREHEWEDLGRFATSSQRGPRLGIVYGRRRQGKSYLLRALAKRVDGLYHQALQEDRASALASLGATVAADAGLSSTVGFTSWDEAVRALARQAAGRRLVVLDELPFLSDQAPELPSVIQRVLDEASSASGARSRGPRLILCGSVMSVMSTLLSGARPLRGRAALELLVQPFDFRTAARYWGIRNPETAFLVHSIVGGTPGYRDLLGGRAPSRPGDLSAWLWTGVLNPSHALFHEAEYLLGEEPAISDRALYQSALAAITRGANTQREIGARLARTDQAMQHPLAVLERAGFIRRDEDVLLGRRPSVRVVDPMLRFHHAVIRPELVRFESRQTIEAWRAAAPRFEAQILGPHFEELAREWTRRFAAPATLGGRPERVGFTHVNDPARRERHQIDVVATGAGGGARPALLAIGEAKAGSRARDVEDLARLQRLREVLATRAVTRSTRLLLFARGGFTRELSAEARRRDDVELVDLARLYGGS